LLVHESGGDVVDITEPEQARTSEAGLPALARRPGRQVVSVPGVVLQGDADRDGTVEACALVVTLAEPAVRVAVTGGVDVDVQEHTEQAGVVTLQRRTHAVAVGGRVRAGEPVRAHVVGREDGLDSERHARVRREVGDADVEHRDFLALEVLAVAVLVDAVAADLGRTRVDRVVGVIAVDIVGVGRVAVTVCVDRTVGVTGIVVVTAVGGVVVVRGHGAVVVIRGVGAVGSDDLFGAAGTQAQETHQGQERKGQGSHLHDHLQAKGNLSS
jgi:hypothetical protein